MLNGKLQKLKEEFEAILEQDRINAENDNYENESGFCDDNDSFHEFLAGKIIELESKVNSLNSLSHYIDSNQLDYKFEDLFKYLIETERCSSCYDQSGNLFDNIIYCGDIEQAIYYLENSENEEEKQLSQLAAELLNFMDEHNITFINA